MVRLTGATLGFFAFAVTIFIGMAAGNPTETTLVRAMQAMFVFFALGIAVGYVGCRVVDEHSVTRHRELFPESEPQPESAAMADESA